MLNGIKRSELDLLFIGGIFPKEREEEVIRKSKRNVQFAANNFQWSLIKGFDSILNKPITIMNAMFIGGFPKSYEDAFIRGSTFSHAEGAKDINLGFINISGIKQLCRPFGEKKFLEKWATDKGDLKKAVIIYSLNPYFIRIAKQLKNANKNIFICITVNDLPKYTMMGKTGVLKKLWKIFNNYRITQSLKLLDGYVLITEQMASYLKITNKPYVVVEALIESDNTEPFNMIYPKEKNKTIVYTGTLTEKYGIMNLIEAFMSLKNDNYRLIICGSGEAADKVVEKAKLDNRIEYRGMLKASETKGIQRAASVLVNPRQDKGEYTKYSFPLKTIEYLFAGTPTVCYKLKGIPHEYDEYLFYVKDDTVNSLAEKIEELCSISEEEQANIRKNSINFVFMKKNNIIQTRKIIDMIEGK